MPDERAVVLAKIDAVRTRRAEVLDAVRSGATDYEGIFELANSDPAIATMKLLPLIEALDGVGKVQSRRALEVVGLEETVLIRAVDGDVRADLARSLFGPRL